MDLIENSFLVVISILIVIEVILIFRGKVREEKEAKVFPKISVLMSVRNEAGTIKKSVDSLLGQSYKHFEVLVADDQSTDGTYELLKSYADKRLSFFKPEAPAPGLNGKASALAALAKKASGDYFAVADADTVYPRQWLATLVSRIGNNGIISGVTGVHSNWLQDVEWKISTGRIMLVGEMGFHTTAIGNNMMVERETYDQAGGFQQTVHTATEDFELNKNILSRGYGSAILFDNKVLATTSSLQFKGLLAQRKRWLRGVKKLPFAILFPLYLKILVIPAVVFFLMSGSLPGITFYILLILSETIVNIKLLHLLKDKINIGRLILFGLYQQVFLIILTLYDAFTPRVRWKGRTL